MLMKGETSFEDFFFLMKSFLINIMHKELPKTWIRVQLADFYFINQNVNTFLKKTNEPKKCVTNNQSDEEIKGKKN